MSIRIRLLLLVLAVWLPAALALAWYASATYKREAEAARKNILQVGDSLMSAVERELIARATLAHTLSRTSAARDGDRERFGQEASAASAGSDSWVFLADRTTLLASTLASGKGTAGSTGRRDGAPFVTDEPRIFFTDAVGPPGQGKFLVMLTPVPGGDAVGFNVGVCFNTSVMQTVVSRFRYPERSVAAILDHDQLIVARSRNPEKWVGTWATGDVRVRAGAGKAGFAESVTLDGIPSLTYLTAPNRFGWTVVVALPKAALSEAARQVTLEVLAASALLLGMGLWLARIAARRISAPVLALKGAAARLGQDAVPPVLATGVSEADDVSIALHEAGLRAREASKVLEGRIEEAVRQAEQAQAKLLEGQKHEAIGRLTGGIAHDFNNLLQTISTSLQVLDKTTSDPRHRKVLESSMRACTRAADLVRQMLTFGRMQAQRPKPLHIRDFMLDHQELMLRAVGARVQLSASIEPGLPGVYVDPTQLELAMLNLLFNASQAMPDGGSVTVTARIAERSETASLGTRPFVCIQVADDGPGMQPDVLARAFEPYFTTKPVGAGSGLGLAQVKSFARQSGGDVLLESGPARGTRACVLLPASDLPIAHEQRPAQETVAQRPLKILMVEDDVLISSVVVPALEAEGHEVRLCLTADDALPILSEGEKFDVVFTDIVMPGKLSGLDLMNWCRDHRPTLATLVTSGYAKELQGSQVQVLNKPYGMQALLAALQRAVDEKREADSVGRPTDGRFSGAGGQP